MDGALTPSLGRALRASIVCSRGCAPVPRRDFHFFYFRHDNQVVRIHPLQHLNRSDASATARTDWAQSHASER